MEPQNGSYLDVENPALGCPVAEVASSTAADVDHAVEAATAAWPAFRATSIEERARMLERAADILEVRCAIRAAVAHRASVGVGVSTIIY